MRRNEMRPATRQLLLAFAVPVAFASAAAGADDDWLLCGPGFRLPERPALEATEPGAEPGTIHLSADEAELVEEGVSKLTGNVVVQRNSQQLRSDEVVYHQSEEAIEARGDVRFWDEGVFVTSDSARAEIGRDVVAFTPESSFMIERAHAHGSAAEVRAFGEERVIASDVSYTTCNPGEADWRITAREIELDRVEDVGVAKGAALEFMGSRVLYLPRISFPLSSRRKSGLLTPSFGTSSSSGAEVAVPYYFNLAPNRDATLTARAMSDRGVQAQGELRFLSRAWGSGRLAAEHLSHDSKFDGDRTAFDLVHRHHWTDRLSTDARLEWVSDKEYLEDLGTGLSQSSRSHLPRRFDAIWRGAAWDALLRFQDFMTLDRTIEPEDRPYAQLPRLVVRTNHPERNHAPNLGLEAELTYFDRDGHTTGTRTDLQPFITFPSYSAGAFLRPKATLHITGYHLNQTDEEAAAGLDDDPARVLPSVSLDSGLFFERPVTLSGRSLTHTIEPRLHYLLVPYERQDDLPNFDTARPAFSFAQLFRENRFFGRDRIGDANRMTLALTSRLLDERGRERARASVGQIRYFRDRRVTLDAGDTPQTSRSSDLVAELEVRPARAWRFGAGLQYDTGADSTEKSVLNARYQPDPRSVVNVGYRSVRDIGVPDRAIEQADLSFAWPMGASWRAVGRWSYALNDDRTHTLEAFGGLEYDSCCWGFRTVVRRYRVGDFTGDGEEDYSNAIYLQLELKGLTGAGDTAEAFVTRGIPGYENEF